MRASPSGVRCSRLCLSVISHLKPRQIGAILRGLDDEDQIIELPGAMWAPGSAGDGKIAWRSPV
jgi:hypothetical protein